MAQAQLRDPKFDVQYAFKNHLKMSLFGLVLCSVGMQHYILHYYI